MAVLVTGATGFLGGRLAQVLAERGEVVRILVRPGRQLRHLASLKVRVVTGGLADTEALAEAVAGVTHIYHCAACSTDWAPSAVYYEANVRGVQNLLAAAANVTRLKRFLHVSTTDVYGYPCVPCAESLPLMDTVLPYNRTKVLGERLVWDAHRAGLPVTVVRPATIYGPRGTVFATEIANHLRQGSMAVIDHGSATGGFIYVDNAVYAIIKAAASDKAKGHAYNLTDETNMTWRGYVNALADGLGCRRPWIDIPSWIAFSMARSMEAVYQVSRVAQRPPLTRHAVYLFSRDQEFPVTKAQRDFGFAPAISFREGVARTVEWLKGVH